MTPEEFEKAKELEQEISSLENNLFKAGEIAGMIDSEVLTSFKIEANRISGNGSNLIDVNLENREFQKLIINTVSDYLINKIGVLQGQFNALLKGGV